MEGLAFGRYLIILLLSFWAHLQVGFININLKATSIDLQLLTFSAILGASVVYSFFWPSIMSYEHKNDIVRGQEGSYVSASMFRCTLGPDTSDLHVRSNECIYCMSGQRQLGT